MAQEMRRCEIVGGPSLRDFELSLIDDWPPPSFFKGAKPARRWVDFWVMVGGHRMLFETIIDSISRAHPLDPEAPAEAWIMGGRCQVQSRLLLLNKDEPLVLTPFSGEFNTHTRRGFIEIPEEFSLALESAGPIFSSK